MTREKERTLSAHGKIMGRPEKPEDARLSERIVVKVTPGMYAAAEQRAAALSTPAAVATVPSYLRMLLENDLRAHGLLGQPESSAAPAPVPYPLPPAPVVLQVTEPAPVEPPAVAEEPRQAAEPVEEPEERTATPAAVRKLLEKAYDAGLTRAELSTRSGVPLSKLSHFRNKTPDQQPSARQIRDIHGALLRWLDENG